MSTPSRLLTSVLFSLMIVATSSFGAPRDFATLKGIVKDVNGRPLSGADVRVQDKKGGSWNKVTKTDASGHYVFNDLPLNVTFRVNLLVNSVVKASINNVTTKSAQPTELNFDLKPESAAHGTPKKGKHMVWVPAQTGSSIGGRWVEAYDDGGHIDDYDAGSTVKVSRGGAGMIKGMQGNNGNSRGGN